MEHPFIMGEEIRLTMLDQRSFINELVYSTTGRYSDINNATTPEPETNTMVFSTQDVDQKRIL